MGTVRSGYNAVIEYAIEPNITLLNRLRRILRPVQTGTQRGCPYLPLPGELWGWAMGILYRECTALLISSLWSDCKNICLPTGIRRPPGSCWKSTPHESELSETDDGIYYMAWSLWRGTWIYSPWASLLVAGSWHCNSWCCARKPKQPNQCNQCKDQNLSYKLFSNTIIFGPHTTRCTQLHTALD